ncbi:uncharacterized protein LOC119464889 isoform X4 [Dermacentor silvarum]|uniref:uncharacterized protein LOC119464889 isoform X4 n=1 Tax=Dermacentor silvarum TaxID=543639 RepID=UPI002101A17A|nr:uncharacterized protein LOC119464889 isoform X4 [Dermacentor silvarum]
MGVVSQILTQLDPPGSILLRAIEINKIGPVDYVAVMENNAVNAPGTLGNLEKYSRTKKEMQFADAVIILIGFQTTHGAQETRRLDICVVCLGSTHDGAESTRECPANGGTIMSPRADGEIRPRYSECSRKAIKEYVTKRAKCLFEENYPMEITTETEVASTTEVPTTTENPEHQKRKWEKCESFLPKNQYLVKAEQMDWYNPTCKILCTAGSDMSDELTVYAVVAPDQIPCGNPDDSKVCKTGLCIHKYYLCSRQILCNTTDFN